LRSDEDFRAVEGFWWAAELVQVSKTFDASLEKHFNFRWSELLFVEPPVEDFFFYGVLYMFEHKEDFFVFRAVILYSVLLNFVQLYNKR
jgi:hypothetical protein